MLTQAIVDVCCLIILVKNMLLNRLIRALLGFFLLKSASGTYLFRLFEIFELFPNDLTGKNMVKALGPNNTIGVQFNGNTDTLKYKGDIFAYMAHMVTTSKDFTFTTTFKKTQKTQNKKQDLVFVSMVSEDYKLTFFNIGLKFARQQVGVEDQEKYVHKTTFYISQYDERYRQTQKTTLELKSDAIPANKWIKIQVRFLGSKFYVRLNCEEVGNGDLYTGQTGVFPYKGSLLLAHDYTKNVFGSAPDNYFIGAMVNPQFINGNTAFEFFSPCEADFTVQEIPSEPLPSEYKPDKFDKFLEMTSNTATVQIQCFDSRVANGTIYSGVTKRDKDDVCYTHTCENGKVSSTYICSKCEDDDKKKYEHGTIWFNVCKNNTCNGAESKYGLITTTTIKCKKTLSCKFGIMRKDNKTCCDKCLSESCRADKEYYIGCDRKCTDGSSFVCLSKKKGCWCPVGSALDDDGKCIPVSKCTCKVGNKTYLPGQSVIRSICETCSCYAGSLLCYAVCFV